jgi:hypothetical protein
LQERASMLRYTSYSYYRGPRKTAISSLNATFTRAFYIGITGLQYFTLVRAKMYGMPFWSRRSNWLSNVKPSTSQMVSGQWKYGFRRKLHYRLHLKKRSFFFYGDAFGQIFLNCCNAQMLFRDSMVRKIPKESGGGRLKSSIN